MVQGIENASKKGMMMILVSWVVLSTLGCLALALVAAKPVPAREQSFQLQSDESDASVFGTPQPRLARVLVTHR